MKKIIAFIFIIVALTAIFTGCSSNKESDDNKKKNETEIIDDQEQMPEIVDDEEEQSNKKESNFMGIIKKIDGDRLQLENDKWVIITDETRFESNLDSDVPVSKDFKIDNFISGYTDDDPYGKEITAVNINYNDVVEGEAELY